jgi:DNA polymerase I
MQDAYRTGDCYLAFGQQAGVIPREANKATHGAQRELFKTCALGTLYGMEAKSLASRIGPVLHSTA